MTTLAMATAIVLLSCLIGYLKARVRALEWGMRDLRADLDRLLSRQAIREANREQLLRDFRAELAERQGAWH